MWNVHCDFLLKSIVWKNGEKNTFTVENPDKQHPSQVINVGINMLI